MSQTKNILSSDVEIEGKLTFAEDLIIDGKIEGEVESKGGHLTIGENAKAKGEIKTKSLVVFGNVEGNITVQDRCELKASTEIVGDIAAGSLAMEEGASFVGASKVGRSAAAAGAGGPRPA